MMESFLWFMLALFLIKPIAVILIVAIVSIRNPEALTELDIE